MPMKWSLENNFFREFEKVGIYCLRMEVKEMLIVLLRFIAFEREWKVETDCFITLRGLKTKSKFWMNVEF